jgi:hypothetical protein
MNIGTPLRSDIFTPAARIKLGANHTGSNSFRMGIALQSTQGHIYAGTVDPQEVADRRRKNRAARRARAAHRKASR